MILYYPVCLQVRHGLAKILVFVHPKMAKNKLAELLILELHFIDSTSSHSMNSFSNIVKMGCLPTSVTLVSHG